MQSEVSTPISETHFLVVHKIFRTSSSHIRQTLAACQGSVTWIRLMSIRKMMNTAVDEAESRALMEATLSGSATVMTADEYETACSRACSGAWGFACRGSLNCDDSRCKLRYYNSGWIGRCKKKCFRDKPKWTVTLTEYFLDLVGYRLT